MDLDLRMKVNYELPNRRNLTRRVPVVIRVDGRAFHTYTASMKKPFDSSLREALVSAAGLSAADMQGVKLVYLQSDEISFLLTDYDTIFTEPWFGYVQNKLESVTASLVTAHFNHIASNVIGRLDLATFDARAFNIPREDVANYFLWRARDWARNSLQMYARAHYSHGALVDKDADDLHELLHNKGLNWAEDLSSDEKNGVFLARNADGCLARLRGIRPTYSQIEAVVTPLLYLDVFPQTQFTKDPDEL